MEVAIFCCFDVCSVRPPQVFQVKAKISTVRPAFPDYISVSYDYDAGYQFLTITLNYKALFKVFLSQYLSWWSFRIFDFFFFLLTKKYLSNFTLTLPFSFSSLPFDNFLSYHLMQCSKVSTSLNETSFRNGLF